MANETLEKMQEIETAAEEVLMGYRTQTQELRQQVDENLRQLGLTYDAEAGRGINCDFPATVGAPAARLGADNPAK